MRNRPGQHRRFRAVLLATVMTFLALLTGCSALSEASDLSTELEAAGFSDASVRLSTTSSDGDTVIVEVGGHESLSGDPARGHAAQVVWTEFPMRFDKLDVGIDGEVKGTTYERLEQQLGPRQGGLDDRSLGEEVGGSLATTFLIIGIVGLVVVIAIAVLIVVLVRRSRRKKQFPPGPPQGPYGPYANPYGSP